MPRFIGRPTVIEAFQNKGEPLPPHFAIGVLRRLNGHALEVSTADGPRPWHPGDYLCRGSDGQFFVMREPQFESLFEEQRPKRPYVRRINEHAEA